MSNRQPISTFLGIAAGLVLASNGFAAIINVPGDFGTIQAAIDDPGTVAGDEIVVAPGIYGEAIDFLGKAIWLRSSGGPEVTTIDGTGFFHVVQCVSGEGPDTVLDGFTITGGNANGDRSPDTLGGGMLNIDTSPTVTNCVFFENSATSRGGGMYTQNSESFLTVTNCTFIGNTTDQFGGGMSTRSFTGSPTVSNCIFSGNSAEFAGGMFIVFENTTVSNCIFTENIVDVAGGGILFVQCRATVINCTFTANSAKLGGATHNNTSFLEVTNSTLWNNSPPAISDAGTDTMVSYSNIEGGWPGTGNIDADPMFVDPDNGDFRLLPGSPCIDAGDNTAVPGDITTDLDGNPRFVDEPDTPDTGLGKPPSWTWGRTNSRSMMTTTIPAATVRAMTAPAMTVRAMTASVMTAPAAAAATTGLGWDPNRK